MDPQQMQQFISGVPPVGGPAGGVPQQQQAPITPFTIQEPQQPVFQPSATQMFPAAPTAPGAPSMGQPPVQGASFTPPAPTWPMAPQQPQFGAPQQVGQVFQQPGQQPAGAPQQRPGEIPLTVPQLQIPGQQQEQVPAWAQKLAEDVAALQTQGPQENQPWDDNNRPRTWAELQQSMEKMAETKAQTLVQGMAQQQQQEAQQQQQAMQVANQNLDVVETQLQQMGMIPAIANPADPNDAGKLARQELYAYAVAMGATEPQHMAPAAMSLYAMHQNGQYFDRTKNSIVTRNSAAPGAFAPIAGAGPTMAGGQPNGAPTGPNQRELSTMSLSALAQRGAAALGLGQ